jgi:hypothetical protein
MMISKRVLFVSFLAFAVLFVTTLSRTAAAHTVKKTGSLKVTLHIPPSDKPTAGIPQTIDLVYDDSSKKFNALDCNCVVSIFSGDKQLYRTPIMTTSPYLSTVDYTFKDPGTYGLNLSGTSRSGSSFQPFNVQFNDIKVIGGQNQGRNILLGLLAMLVVAVPALMLLSYVMTR